ncbi:MAG: PfkB family carbohydrate kinase [Chloroflexota bacterium]
MLSKSGLEPIDYLIIGHLTNDLTHPEPRIGGTAAYAALTAHAFGLRVGIVTSWGKEHRSELFDEIQIVNHETNQSTTFENMDTDDGRELILHHKAPDLDYYHIPQLWRSSPLVHIAPVAQEVNPGIVRYFGENQVYMTPQGFMREWNQAGHIKHTDWPEAAYILQQVEAAVISVEDVENNDVYIETLAQALPILLVTDGENGSDLYTQGETTHIPASPMTAVDTTGAGDIFAATLFIQYDTKKNALEAAQFAAQIAGISVSREGLNGIPTQDDLYDIQLPEVN